MGQGQRIYLTATSPSRHSLSICVLPGLPDAGSRGQAATSWLKDLGGWKIRSMVDRYAKLATEHLAAASRIESPSKDGVIEL